MYIHEVLKNERRIHRKAWAEDLYLLPSQLCVCSAVRNFSCAIKKEDLVADDWEVIQEPFDTAKAKELLQFGKRVRRTSWDECIYIRLGGCQQVLLYNDIIQRSTRGLFIIHVDSSPVEILETLPEANDWVRVCE